MRFVVNVKLIDFYKKDILSFKAFDFFIEGNTYLIKQTIFKLFFSESNKDN